MSKRAPTAVVILVLGASILYAPSAQAAGSASLPATLNGYFAAAVNFLAELFDALPQPASREAAVASSQTTAVTPPTVSSQPTGTTQDAPSVLPATVTKTIYQYVPAPTSPAVTVSTTGVVTEAALDQKLAALQSEISTITGNPPISSSALLQSLAYTNAAAGNSTGATLNNVIVNRVSGLTSSDIPNLSSTYLSTIGGTVSGNLTVTGAFAGSALSLANASTTLLSVTGPAYFGATATSTFDTDGTLSLAKALGVASGGTGWTNINSGSLLFGNGSSALATSSSLFWDNANGRLGIGTTSPQSLVQIAPTSTTTNDAADGVLTRIDGIVGGVGARGLVITPKMAGTNTAPAGIGMQPEIQPGINLTSATGMLTITTVTGHNGNGNITNLYNNQMRVDTQSTYSGAITNAHNIYIMAPNFAGPKPVTMYGVHIANQGVSGITTSYGLFVDSQSNSTNNYAGIFQGGNLGVATTSPWRTLSVTGTVGFDGITSVSTNQSAYLCLSSNKEVVQDSTTCLASSARFKQDITPLSASSSLAEVMALNPVSFGYTPAYNGALQSDPNFNGTFVGFIAEDVAKVDPRLITVDATGTTPTAPHGVRYENITAILAGAIKQIGSELASLEATIAGFAQSFTSDVITANKQLCVRRSNGTSVCVTGDQLDAILSQTGQTGTAGQGSAATSSAIPEDATSTSTAPSTDATITITDIPPDATTTTPDDASTTPS